MTGLQWIWLLCALGMLTVRLFVVPRLFAHRGDRGIRFLLQSFGGMVSFELSIIVVTGAGIFWPGRPPEWLGITLTLILSAGYLSAELSSLRLNLFFLNIFEYRQRGETHPDDPVTTGSLPDLPTPDEP